MDNKNFLNTPDFLRNQRNLHNEVLNKVIENELKVIKQTILEVRHAQNSGAEWYTKGHSGLFMQIKMWLDKADEAIKSIEALETK